MMQNNIKNFIIILLILILVFFSFLIPNIFFRIEDMYMENDIFNIAQNSSNLDVEIQKIYLVRAIHDIKNSIFKIASQNITEMNNLKFKNTFLEVLDDELKKLEENEIIQSVNREDYDEFTILKNDCINNDNEYTLQHFYGRSNEYYIEVDIEKKTGKIIKISFNKDILNTDINKSEILENYIKYLNLYIIDDWKFENNQAISEKAGLCVIFIEDTKNNQLTLSINSTISESTNVSVEYSEIE